MPLPARKPSQELLNIDGALGGRWCGYVAKYQCPTQNDRDPGHRFGRETRASSSPLLPDPLARMSAVSCAPFPRRGATCVSGSRT